MDVHLTKSKKSPKNNKTDTIYILDILLFIIYHIGFCTLYVHLIDLICTPTTSSVE
jgi:hypothetical protein